MAFNISSFLDKYKGLRDPKEERVKVANIISKEIGFDIDQSVLNIKKGVLFFKTDSYLKSEVFILKEKLLDELKKAGLEIFDIK